ncbi:MAG: Rha family transcriptional regulator [Thauera sp.]|jgi:Rha family phage regulatory protein|nr:Rha family transcriptional regulator [Thauera sp.]
MRSAPDRKAGSAKTTPRPHSTTSLVLLDSGEVWTNSLLIAEKFGKRHDNVLQAIERVECSTEFRRLNFQGATYLDDQGKARPMCRISRDGFSFLAMGFTGRIAAEWKEKFIAAFNHLETELLRATARRLSSDWQEARQLGKLDRRELTDAVQALCERAHERGDSTTPVDRWMMNATRAVTVALFQTNGERIQAIRDRLTARQLRRLALAEQTYADEIENFLDSDLHHRSINEQAKVCIEEFAAATGGRQVPGVDRRPARLSGFIDVEMATLLALGVLWAWAVIVTTGGAA